MLQSRTDLIDTSEKAVLEKVILRTQVILSNDSGERTYLSIQSVILNISRANLCKPRIIRSACFCLGTARLCK